MSPRRSAGRPPFPRRLGPPALALTLALAGGAAVAPAGAETVHVEQLFSRGEALAGELDGLARRGDGLVPAAIAGAARGVYRSGPVAAPLAFTAVGPHWRADLPAGTGLVVELSTSADGAAWTPFHRVAADPHAEPAAVLPDGRANPFDGDTVGALTHRSRGDGRWVRYRVTLERGGDAAGDPRLERLTLTFIDSSRPHPEAGLDLESGPRRPEAPAAYPKPAVWSRGQWGARPPVCTYSYCSVTHVGIHHTAGVAEYSCSGFDDCAADVRAIQSYHMDVNGWCDVGYNYLSSSDGALWEGRGGGDDVVGAHDGFNCGSMGVANMGYYHPPYDHLWTEAQIDAVAELSAWKADQKGIDPFGASWYAGYGGVMDNVYGHRDVKSTACPGDTIYPRLGELRSRIDDKLSGGGGDEIVRDNPSATLKGDWTTGTSAPDKYGTDYYWTSTGTGDRRVCAWTVDLPSAGTWEVAFWWSQGSNRNPATRVGVKQGALQTFTVNQQTGGGRWNPVGSFSFSAGTVRLGVVSDGAEGWVVICDAVRLKKLD